MPLPPSSFKKNLQCGQWWPQGSLFLHFCLVVVSLFVGVGGQ